MPAFTYLSQHEVESYRKVTGDFDCDTLLQELRHVSGEDWLVSVRKYPLRPTWADRLLRRPVRTEEHYTLYADCGGEWQIINYVLPDDEKGFFCAGKGSREGVMNYMLGFIAGLYRARLRP